MRLLRLWWLRHVIRSRQSMLCWMIKRRRADHDDDAAVDSHEWSDAKREKTPEAYLLDRVERYGWLRDAGLDDAQAIELMGGQPGQGLIDLIASELTARFPGQAKSGRRQLDQWVRWCMLWT